MDLLRRTALVLVHVTVLGVASGDRGAVPWSAQLALTLLVAVPLLLLGAWVVGNQLREWWVRSGCVAIDRWITA